MSSALRLGVVLLLLSAAVVCAENKESKDINTNNNNNDVKKEADKDTTTTNNDNNEVKKEADVDTTTNNDNNEVKKEADDATTNSDNNDVKKEADDATTNSDNNDVKKEAGQEMEEKRQAMDMGNPYFNQNYFSPWSFMNSMYPGYFHGGFAGAPPMYPYSPGYLANPMMYSGHPFAGGYPGYPMQGMFQGFPGYGFQNSMYPGYGYPNGLLFSSPMQAAFPRYLVPANGTNPWGFLPGGFAGAYPMYPSSPGYLANPMMYPGYPFAGGYPGYPMQGMFHGYPYQAMMYSGYPFAGGYPGYPTQGMFHGYPSQAMMYSGYPFAGGYPGYPMQGMFHGYPYQPGYPGLGMQSWYGGMGMSAFPSPVGGMGSLFYPQPGYVGWNYPHWHQSNASKESPLLKAIYNLGGESTAPQRPSQEELKKLLSEHPWTREMLFNNTDDEIVKALTDAKSLDELKKKLNLSDDKVNNLRNVFKAVKEDNVAEVIELGEKEDHWQDFKKLFKAILDSGFQV